MTLVPQLRGLGSTGRGRCRVVLRYPRPKMDDAVSSLRWVSALADVKDATELPASSKHKYIDNVGVLRCNHSG